MSKNINRLINNFWSKIVGSLSKDQKQKIVKFSAPAEKCNTCAIVNAKWFNSLSKEYACDNCIPRGCSCRLKKKSDRSGFNIQDYEYMMDKHGRELPCEDWSKF